MKLDGSITPSLAPNYKTTYTFTHSQQGMSMYSEDARLERSLSRT
jgi:hypothetical protein